MSGPQETRPPSYHEDRGVYLQIARELQTRIRASYQPGDRLPSERALAVEFGVHRNTIRRAIETLNRAGTISTAWGARSVATKKRLNHRITFDTSFTASALAAGVTPRTELASVTGLASRNSLQICRRLVQGDPTGEVTTIRYVDDEPVCWIRHLLFGFDAQQIMAGFEGTSIHQWLREKTGASPQRCESTVGADRATSIDCKMLRVSRGASILYSHSVNNDPRTGQVMELSITRFRSEAAELKMTL
jgi:DNA-binding GntR family transcriptional regulator